MTTNIGAVYGPVSGPIAIQKNHFGGPSTDELTALYYRQTAKECEGLTLAAVNPVGEGREKAFAEDTYVPPDVWVIDEGKADETSANVERESRRVPLHNCLNSDDAAMRRLVLTAPSGFGKSTAVNVRVGAIAKGASPWLMLRLPSLRRQSSAPGDASITGRVERALQKDIRDKVKCDETQAILIADAVIDRLDASPGVMLFDALDEVPQGERDEVVNCVRSFLNERARQQPNHRVLITSRPYAYTEQFAKDQFKRIELAEFTPAQQDELVAKWFAQWDKSAETGDALVRQLQTARSGVSADQTGLTKLMTEPMLLTYACMLAEGRTVANSDTPLPPTRHELFDGVVSLMLEKWDPNRRTGVVHAYPELFLSAPGQPSLLRRCLERAAVSELTSSAPMANPYRKEIPPISVVRLSDVTLERLVHWLDEAMPDGLPVRARTVVDWLAERSGLLHATRDENGTRYVLQAQLRDFLAVGGLRAEVRSDQQLVHAMLTLLRGQPEWYRPSASMTLSRLRSRPLELAYAINQILAPPDVAENDQPPDTVAKLNSMGATPEHAILHFVIAWANAFGASGPSCANDPAVDEAVEKLRNRCLDLVTAPAEGKPPIELRAEAADALGLIGDPRFDPLRWHLPAKRLLSEADEPIPGFVRIAGDFMMGDKREKDNPPRKVRIENPFYIARYATTVAQFRHFVNVGGYEEKQWWDDDGLLWLSGEYDKRVQDNEHLRWLRGRPVQERRAPASWAHQLQSPSCVVIGVSWFEARAYARWLDHSLHRELRVALPSWHKVQLPTEPQWERAARWATGAKGYDDRRWPWGNDEADAALHGNVGEGLGRVASVGLYEPTGPKLLDMAGNAWEWMDNAYSTATDVRFDRASRDHVWRHADNGEDSETLSLRGGSWAYQPVGASCSSRAGTPPDFWYHYLGFRVVLSLAKK